MSCSSLRRLMTASPPQASDRNRRKESGYCIRKRFQHSAPATPQIAPSKPPTPQAVPFTSFDYAKIESREPVAEKLKEFMKRTKEANFFTTGLIIAEWGEGKTDAYERYIKPEALKKGDYAYLVSTSTIVNKLSRASSLFPYGPPESLTLAACIFMHFKTS
jgi:hypothetical protein